NSRHVPHIRERKFRFRDRRSPQRYIFTALQHNTPRSCSTTGLASDDATFKHTPTRTGRPPSTTWTGSMRGVTGNRTVWSFVHLSRQTIPSCTGQTRTTDSNRGGIHLLRSPRTRS
ncbi:unnamed protein product, partial [Ectocarpus sp. 12 AP-2014]